MYQLYYYPMNASFAPHVLLEELKVDYELLLVDRKSTGQKAPEYLKLNPTGRIPTLVHEGLVLFESSAICLYLAEQDSTSRFIPSIGSETRPYFYQWLQYLTGTVQSELMLYLYPEAHTTDLESAKNITEAQNQRLAGMFELLDNTLKDSRYLIGDEVTVCDHVLLMLSLWADELSKPPLSYPNLRRYLSELASREAVREVCRQEKINLSDYS